MKYTDYVTQFKGHSIDVYTEEHLFGHIDGEVLTIPAKQTISFSVSEYQLNHAIEEQINRNINLEQVKIG